MASGRRLVGSFINFSVAVLFFGLAISRILVGYLPANKAGHKAITLADNPGAFWITIGLMLFASFIFLCFGVFSMVRALRSRM